MKNFDWNQARAFRAAAATGSFSAAARALGLTQPTISRQVAALEARLGVTLFERLGKKLAITESGIGLLDQAHAMGEAAETMALNATGLAQAVEGPVAISASDGFAVYILPPILGRIRAIAPRVTVEIVASNALSDLRRREADIAIRHVRPEQPDLIGRWLRDTEAHLYASHEWVARNGMPRSPQDLVEADFIGFDQTDRLVGHLNAWGVPVKRENFRLLSANSVAVWEMVKLGLGVSVMARDIAEKTPGVVRLLPDLAPAPVPIWLVTHRELHTNRRIRLVFDALAEALG